MNYVRTVICNNILTIHTLVKQLDELVNGSLHLLPGQVQEGHHSEAQLLKEVGQCMDVHGGGQQARVVGVI